MLPVTPAERPAAREANASPRDAAARESATRESATRNTTTRNTTTHDTTTRDTAPRRPAAGSPSPRLVRESTMSGSDSDPIPTDEGAQPAAAARPEFSALLAMLAGAGVPARQDLMTPLPEAGVSLVDHLLDGAAPEASVELPSTGGEALHYGLLQIAPPVPTPGTDDAPALLTAAPPMSTRPTDAPAVATSPAAGTASRRADAASDRNRTLEAIARVANQRGTSVEQLLALGDTRGAAAKQSLEALLDAAGTPAGARLAARQLMAASQRSLLGGDDSTLDAMASLEALTTRAGGPAVTTVAATTGAATTVATPARDLTGVSPELQARVQRVIERMQQEYGHDVTIVETTRTQARQDWLYEQGRTRDGQVVTWTRDSAHTRGDAVDVLIDGSYTNAEGFARLQRIAREEGLRTLGPRDPGHLELPRNGGEATGALLAAAPRAARMPEGTESMPAARGMARVAGVAGVATVATVATAAGRGMADADTGEQNASRDRAPRGLAAGRATRANGSGANAESAAFTMGPTTSNLTGGTTTAVNAAPAMSGSAQAERVADLQQRRAEAPAAPLSRMTLDVAGIDGTSERITVDVRGSSVSAHIATDAATADRLRLRTADLQDALGRHGLDGDSVRISATSRALDGTESARAGSGERDALRLVASAGSTPDGTGANGQQGRAPRQWDAQDDARREQAARARDERQQRSRQDADDAQERQRRQTLFTGNA